MGKSKWVKLTPWYYTGKRQQSRRASKVAAIASECVTVNPNIRFGRPAVNGISVEAICEQAESGMSEEEIASDYGLSLQAVRAALTYDA